MFFKNLIAYRIPLPFPITMDELNTRLLLKAFTGVGEFNAQSTGWVSPRDNDLLVHHVQGKALISMITEKKILPGSVVTRHAREKAKEIEQLQGYKCGRKQFKEIKEAVTDELLAKALTTQQTTRVIIDTVNGWLMVDTASPGRAQEVMKALLAAIGNFPFWTFNTKMSPSLAMTEWIQADDNPQNFTVDQDVELKANLGSASVRIKNQTLEVDEIRRHIASGKTCTQLALTYADRLSFVLNKAGQIKRLVPTDMLQESNREIENDDERFDADLLIMADSMHKLLVDLGEALGGEEERQTEEEKQQPLDMQDPPDDELYPRAVQVVQEHKRPSISLIQRHLRIGYNRAARLLDQMEAAGIVSAMQSNGQRELLIETETA